MYFCVNAQTWSQKETKWGSLMLAPISNINLNTATTNIVYRCVMLFVNVTDDIAIDNVIFQRNEQFFLKFWEKQSKIFPQYLW